LDLILARASVSQAGSDFAGAVSAATETTHGAVAITIEASIFLAKFQFNDFIM
jgi:hypothetical protein